MGDGPLSVGLVPQPVPQDERDTLFREIEGTAGIGGYVWEPGRRLVWSDGFFRLLEIDPADGAGGAIFFERVHPEDRARILEEWRRAYSGELQPSQYRIVRKDGTIRHLRGQGTVTRGPDGQVIRIVGSILDVTDIHETAERLARVNAVLAETQSAAGVGSYVYDLADRQFELSGTMYEILGLDPARPASEDDVLTLIHPDDRARHADWVQRLLDGESLSPLLLRIVRRDGRICHLEIRSRRTATEQGGHRLLGLALDVTSRIELQDRLQQAAKMEAVGTLAAGVAHDFNNYLMVILFHLEESRRAGAGDPAPLRDALHAAEQCAVLTRQLLAFGRKQPPAMRELDLGALAVSVAGLLRRVCRADVVIEVEQPTSPMIIEADAGQLEGVLMNLAVNARDAMPSGGRMRFSFEECELAIGHPVLEPGNPPGRYTCLRVLDTGTGIAPEHLARIFDPYFSTKEAGRGTGLGLASVYGIIRQHGGFVRVHSQLGCGTTFLVYLRSKQTRSTAQLNAPPLPVLALAPLHGLHILVAEDVEAVRRTVVTGLTRAGARVTAAADGQLALDQLMSGLQVDLLLTDLIMPRMGGLELARTVRKLRPDLPIGFMTGYVDRDVIGEISLDDATVPILKKPFTIEELITTVAQAVEERRDAARARQ
jgi:two-component system, cell cycle sensor histidine kinase and response regulator CckA